MVISVLKERCFSTCRAAVEEQNWWLWWGLYKAYSWFFPSCSQQKRDARRVQTACSEENVIQIESLCNGLNPTCWDCSCPARWSILLLFSNEITAVVGAVSLVQLRAAVVHQLLWSIYWGRLLQLLVGCFIGKKRSDYCYTWEQSDLGNFFM